MFNKLGDFIFNILYQILWAKASVLFLFVLAGIVCLWGSFQDDTIQLFTNLADYEYLLSVEGEIEEIYHKKGGRYNGTECIGISLSDGNNYYIYHGDEIDICLAKGLLDVVQKGDYAKLEVYDTRDISHNLKIYAISVNETSYISREEGLAIFSDSAQRMEDEIPIIRLIGILCLLYPAVVLVIRKILD